MQSRRRIFGLEESENCTPDMKNKTQLSLLEELQSENSEAAWFQFCEVYEELIDRWLRSQGLQSSDVDDVRQEVFATIHAEIGSFTHNGRTGAFRCWLRRIVSNRLKRQWEVMTKRDRFKADVNLSAVAEQLADDCSDLSVALDREHDIFVLQKLLDTASGNFSKEHMELFRRITIESEDAGSVASDFGMTLGAVRVAQHRVLKELRRIAGSIIE